MKVTFQIEGASPVIIECNAGDNLLELARRGNVAIDAPAPATAPAASTASSSLRASWNSFPAATSPTRNTKEGWRLSCSSKVCSDCTVFVPDIASAYQSRMKTADLSSPVEVAIFDECQENLKNSGIHFVNRYKFKGIIFLVEQ